MRAQKLREEAVKKERDEHFNDFWLVILMKQEWRVKEKADAPTPQPPMRTWTCWTTMSLH
jgi:hypothetical protein